MNKRIISVLMATLLLLSCFSVIPTFALDSNEPRITVDTVEAQPGDEIAVNVRIDNNPGIWGMNIKIIYDTSALKLTNVENGGFFKSSEWTKGNLKNDFYILSYESDEFEDVTASSGILAKLIFKVDENASKGKYSVNASYTPGDIINIDFDDVNFGIENGAVNVIGAEEPSTEPTEEDTTPVEAPKITLEKVTAKPGDEVDVKVRVENNPGIWGMNLTVAYDTSAMKLTNVENGDFFSNSEWTKGNLNNDVYILSYEAGDFENITTPSGVLAVLHFKVSDNAVAGSYSVNASYTPGDIINIDFDDVNFGIENGTVNVAESENPSTEPTEEDTVPADEPMIIIDNVTAKPGDEALVEVRIKNNPGIYAMNLKISYDNSAMRLTSVENGEIFADYEFMMGNLDMDVYTLYFQGQFLEDITTDSGVLAVLHFKINENTAEGDYGVNISHADIINVSIDEVDFNIINGMVTVSGGEDPTEPDDYLIGDVNNDGEINVKDASEILKYTVALVELDERQLRAGDVNKDGYTNIKDSSEIQKYTVHLSSVLDSIN